ncbi:MAG: DUF1801 domain-containing protein [Bacteroidetes bacterium]|nr:DUF1801 domain-containing protein [Bacteroidota bacterium]
MQNVQFRNVNEFLDFLQDDELEITEFLRELVLSSIPNITEKLSYNVPFYKMNKGMFFIWPASVLWGKKRTRDGVRFGFQQGYLLADEIGYLERGTRQQIFWKTFTKLKDIDTEILKSYIFDAAFVDEQFASSKRK